MSRGSFVYKKKTRCKRKLVKTGASKEEGLVTLTYEEPKSGETFSLRLQGSEEDYEVELLSASKAQAGSSQTVSEQAGGTGFNRFWISVPTSETEHIYGCGETYSKLDLKGEKVRIWVAEHQNARRIGCKLIKEKLFGKRPQKYFITSEVKCVQFFGDVVEKPLPSYQICRGTLFEMIDQATAFVMTRVDLAVGTRAEGTTAQAPTEFELPPDAVKEAIVNAVAHRDYTSNGSVQVMLFRNRLEVWNPGQLPYGLTVSKLTEPHKSLPANPLIADPLFWTGYVDKVGTGTMDIVTLCKEKGLKAPEYHQEEDFRVVIWRKKLEKGLSEGLSKGPSKGLSRDQVCAHLGQKWERIEQMIRGMVNPSSAAEIRAIMGMTNASKFKKNYLDLLIGMGAVMMTDPDSPNSPQQRYVLTEAGRKLLEMDK